MPKQKLVLLLIAGAFFILYFLNTDLEHNKTEQQETEQGEPVTEKFLVTRVIDGDTIEVKMNGEIEKVRYIGIDTPELSYEGLPEECFATSATTLNQSLVEGKQVTLIKDVSETDKYDRLLRYVYVDEMFVNEVLVESGAAEAKRYYPDTREHHRLQNAEAKAREARLGIWSKACLVD